MRRHSSGRAADTQAAERSEGLCRLRGRSGEAARFAEDFRRRSPCPEGDNARTDRPHGGCAMTRTLTLFLLAAAGAAAVGCKSYDTPCNSSAGPSGRTGRTSRSRTRYSPRPGARAARGRLPRRPEHLHRPRLPVRRRPVAPLSDRCPASSGPVAEKPDQIGHLSPRRCPGSPRTSSSPRTPPS